MRTIDHKLLGIYLMKKAALHHKISMLDKVAFLWGNVEPDINCFTHLKGFLQHRTFRGHHFQSCCIRIQILLKRINEDDFNITKYYRMGKLTHCLGILRVILLRCFLWKRQGNGRKTAQNC